MDERKSISKKQALKILEILKTGKIDYFETYQGFEESTYYQDGKFYAAIRNMNRRDEEPVVYEVTEKELIKHIIEGPFFRYGYLLKEE